MEATGGGSVKILVAEDDPFQRLSLLDILTLCEYDVTPAENGKQALDFLLDQENHFDLVLLDLIMPEMSGREVLKHMRNDQRLNQIPVIVMSAKDDKQITADCLQAGAKSFIVKPLRIQECKALVSYIGTTNNVDTEQGLNQYIKLRNLGRGAAGSVDLVKHKVTGEKFALKTVPLAHLSQKERSFAESEVQFLKVLVGPTLVRSFESFIE